MLFGISKCCLCFDMDRGIRALAAVTAVGNAAGAAADAVFVLFVPGIVAYAVMALASAVLFVVTASSRLSGSPRTLRVTLLLWVILYGTGTVVTAWFAVLFLVKGSVSLLIALAMLASAPVNVYFLAVAASQFVRLGDGARSDVGLTSADRSESTAALHQPK